MQFAGSTAVTAVLLAVDRHRTNSFAVEFPDDPSATPMEVRSVTFDAETSPAAPPGRAST